MLQTIKDQVRTHPRLFDALRRVIPRRNDPAYAFFKAWSESYEQVNFIQIGASDGLRNDPFREFILQGWKGILVEPIPDVFDLLKRNYAHCRGLTFVNAAITSENGSLPFYDFDPEYLATLPLEERLELQRKASFSREHVARFRDNHIRETTVPCLTMETLLRRHWNGEPIHLLAIDAEGHEPTIIQSIDFDSFRPDCIFYESHTLKRDVRLGLAEYLREHGYNIEQILGDTAAIHHAAA